MTKQHLTLTTQLIRLSKNKVGMKESALLFATADGATLKELCAATRECRETVKGRLRGATVKGLIECLDGSYCPTEKGWKIIASAFPKE